MNILKQLFTFTPRSKPDNFTLSSKEEIDYDVREEREIKKDYVSADIEKNIAYIRKRYAVPLNNDVVIREIGLKNGRKAFILFFDGMVDGLAIDEYIISALIELPYIQEDKFDDELYMYFTAHSQTTVESDMDNIADGVNFGSCALFVDGVAKAFVFDVKQWEHRGID